MISCRGIGVHPVAMKSAVSSVTAHPRKQVPLKLPADLALDLQAFCEAHFNAPQNQIICAAVRDLIRRELEVDQVAQGRFATARERLQERRRASDSIRLIGG